MDYDYLVFIGRFEPFHRGHAQVAADALARANKLIVLVGSADTPRTTKNPWSAAERAEMIFAALGGESARVIVLPLRDRLYNEKLWISEVQRLVAQAVADDGGDGQSRIGLAGLDKDASSYYLREFPQWPLLQSQHTEVLSATELRNYYFGAAAADGDGGLRLLRANVPAPVYAMLESFRVHSSAYPQLVREQHYLQTHRASWASAPYPPTFVTVDAVVVHSGHVLLVRRRREPGQGQWALPGGFIEAHESLLDGALRELREETGLPLTHETLKSALRARQVFDHPQRSLRGRTITHAFHFDFPSGPLPQVAGGDDAADARWFALADALRMEPQLFEDHYHILDFFLARS